MKTWTIIYISLIMITVACAVGSFLVVFLNPGGGYQVNGLFVDYASSLSNVSNILFISSMAALATLIFAYFLKGGLDRRRKSNVKKGKIA